MGKLSEWFRKLLAELNLQADDTLAERESTYKDSGQLEREDYLLSELGAYVHAIIETLENDTMGKVFTHLGQRVAAEFSVRPHLRDVYLLADDPLKVPINKSRRLEPSHDPRKPNKAVIHNAKQLTPAEEAFALARLKKLVTMPMNAGQREIIHRELEQITLPSTKQGRENLLCTPTTRMLLEIGMARIWAYHMCEAAVAAKKANVLMIYLEGVACFPQEYIHLLQKHDFSSEKLTEAPKLLIRLRYRRRMLAGDLLNASVILGEMPFVYDGMDVDYPGEADHKIFPIITNPESRPSSRLPCYGVTTSDYDIIFFLLVNLPRLILVNPCNKCDKCRSGQHCIFKNKIARDVVVHMKSAYSKFTKDENGAMIEAEEPRRAFKIVPLYRAIHKALRSRNEFKWMMYPFDTIIFLILLCASKTDYCDGLPGIGPGLLFKELAIVSKDAELRKKYRDMVVVDPFSYIGHPRVLVTPTINFDKVRSFVVGMYSRKHATVMAKSDRRPDARTRQYTLDQIFDVDKESHKLISSIDEKHFKILLENVTWNYKYIFNGFIDATEYRSNCIELDSTGNPRYGWKNKATDEALGASHHINSAFITNDF